jgi:phosphoglycerate dehydrogenase-like enzyme
VGEVRRVEILVYHPKLSSQYAALIEEAVAPYRVRSCAGREETRRHIGTAEVLFAASSFPGELLEEARALRWIQVMGAGVDRFTLGARPGPGTRLTRMRTTFGARIAEYVLAHILADAQGLRRVFAAQTAKVWDHFIPDLVTGRTAGVAGLGNVGRSVAAKLHAVGMDVIGLDLAPVAEAAPFISAQYPVDRLREFLGRVDYLVLCLPLTAQTEGMLGDAELAWMKPSAVLLNVARARLVAREALVRALRSGVIRGAVLDVFWEEPLTPDSDLWDLPGLVVTPHLAGPSVPSEVAAAFLENFRRYLAGRPLLDEVDPARGY